jgi:nicotinamide-nucleotide amidase
MNIVEALSKQNLTISVIESFTGGGFAHAITNIPGSSKVFKGGIVAYSKEAKINIAKLDPELISKHGVISGEVTMAMARQAKKLFKTDIGIGFSGNAGPTASENKPIGMIYIAIIHKDKEILEKLELNMSREEIKKHSINYTINKILDIIL